MTSPGSPGAAEAGSPHPRRRLLKIMFIILSLLMLGAVTLVSIWTARRYQQAVELAKRAREQYGALNSTYPFAPPPPGRELPARRWQAMLRVHEEIQCQTPPELRRRLEALLRVRSLRAPAIYRELMAGVPQVGAVLNAQIDAFRGEQMSAREYQWMLGLGIVRVMESAAYPPAGDGTRRVLEQLERLTHADADPGNDVDAGAVFDFLREKYRGAAGPGPEVLQALRGRDEAACAIDLLLAMVQWAAPEGQAPESLLRKVLPRR